MDQRMAAAVRIERNQNHHRHEESKGEIVYEDTEEGDFDNSNYH